MSKLVVSIRIDLCYAILVSEQQFMWNLFIYLIPISFTECKRRKGEEKGNILRL